MANSFSTSPLSIDMTNSFSTSPLSIDMANSFSTSLLLLKSAVIYLQTQQWTLGVLPNS